jgi:hypothetical protein
MTAGEQDPYHTRVRFFFTNSGNTDRAASVGVQLLPRLEDTRSEISCWFGFGGRTGTAGSYTQPNGDVWA